MCVLLARAVRAHNEHHTGAEFPRRGRKPEGKPEGESKGESEGKSKPKSGGCWQLVVVSIEEMYIYKRFLSSSELSRAIIVVVIESNLSCYKSI